MSRWLVLTVPSIALLAGCAPPVEFGLANGPRLGGNVLADEPVHDVISDGSDACGRFAEYGPLRGRMLACATVAHPVVGATLLPVAAGGKGEGLVVPWLKHFYVGWPCPHPAASPPVKTLAWTTSSSAPLACTRP
jgi:hypothetical protein